MQRNQAQPNSIINAGKHVRISVDRLDVDWMQADKFAHAESCIEKEDNESRQNIVISLPLNVRKVTTEYYKYKFEQACAQLVNQSKTSINIREVPGLLKVRKVKPKDLLEKKKIQVCGSMTGKWLLDTVKEKQKKQQEAKNKKAKDIESFLI